MKYVIIVTGIIRCFNLCINRQALPKQFSERKATYCSMRDASIKVVDLDEKNADDVMAPRKFLKTLRRMASEPYIRA